MTDVIFSEYELEMHQKLLSLHYHVHYRIDPNRPDLEDFIKMLKHRIDVYDDFIFIKDMKFFMRTYTIQNWDQENFDYNMRLLYEYRLSNPLEVLVKKKTTKER